MSLAFSIARRFLGASKVQSFLIALGIAIGVSVQIFIGSLIQGLQADLVNTTIGSQPQITVKSDSKDGLIPDQPELREQLASDFAGVKNVSPAADGPALLTANDSDYSILLRGMDFSAAEGIYHIEENLIQGRLPGTGSEAAIGRELSEESGLVPGDSLTLLSGSGKKEVLTVTGIFDLKNASLNRSWVFTTLPSAQSVLEYGDSLTSVEMQVEDVFQAETTAASIQSVLSSGLKADNWMAQNAALLSGLNGQSISSYMIQVFVMISVLLGIASVLAISAVQKSKQIGILKAMGIRDTTASLIFVLQGFLLGILGAIMGILLGLGLAYAFTRFALDPAGQPIIPLTIDPGFIAFSAGAALLVSTLASLIPARKTSRLDPIEVIRNA